MAVAHDAASESHAGTTGSVSEASFSWSHNPVGTPRGVLVYTFVVDDSSDLATAVTYGGASLSAVSSGRAVDTAGEPGDCKAWFLGTSVPTDDPATVVVTRTNNTRQMYAVAITVTAGGNTEVTGVVLVQEDGAFVEELVDDGSPGTDSVRYAGTFSGRLGPPSPGISSTALEDIDFGSVAVATVRETTAGQGNRLVGFLVTQSDDRAAVHLAIREISGSTLSGALFTKAPTFFTGAITTAVTLSGTLFAKAATFRDGDITLQGVVFYTWTKKIDGTQLGVKIDTVLAQLLSFGGGNHGSVSVTVKITLEPLEGAETEAELTISAESTDFFVLSVPRDATSGSGDHWEVPVVRLTMEFF